MSGPFIGTCPHCGNDQVELRYEKFAESPRYDDAAEIYAFRCEDCDAILGVSSL